MTKSIIEKQYGNKKRATYTIYFITKVVWHMKALNNNDSCASLK